MQYRLQNESAKAIKAFAYKALRRCHAAGARSIELDDIQNECWIAYTKACRSYDESMGVPFLAYLRNGMRMQVNRFIDDNVSDRHAEVIGSSLDAGLEGDEGEEFSIAAFLASPDPDPSEIAERNNHLQRISELVSDDTRIFLNLLVDPPQILLQQVRQLVARADYARSQGLPAYATTHLTFGVVIEAMGASRKDRVRFLDEINEAIRRISRTVSRTH